MGLLFASVCVEKVTINSMCARVEGGVWSSFAFGCGEKVVRLKEKKSRNDGEGTASGVGFDGF